MTTGSGLDAQVGYKLESTVGTAVTVDKFVEFNSEGFDFDPGFIEPEGLRVGVKYKRGSRLVQSRTMVTGALDLNYPTRLMGGLWKAALGSSVTTPTLITDGYSQSHQTGDLLGKSLTVQVGRPQPSDQVVKAHTYSGCKVTGWEWSVSDNEVAKFHLDFDGWNEATATSLASASFVTGAEEFNFSQASVFSMGGTIGGTTTLTYTGGTSVASIVKSISIKGDNALATERFGLGNSGIKKEQLENGIPTITGSMEAEYLQSDFYTPFKANTSTSLRLKLVGNKCVAAGTDNNTLDFIIPQIRIKKVSPQVSGPDLVSSTVEFEVYSDGTNNPFQVYLISADSAAI